MWGKALLAVLAIAFVVGVLRLMMNASPLSMKDDKTGWGWKKYGRFGRNPADWY